MTEPDPFSLMEISFQSELWEKDPEFSLEDIRLVLNTARNHFPLFRQQGHVDIVLGDDLFLQELNASYRSKNKPTNVLSFPQEELQKGTYLPCDEFMLLGDIVLSYPTIKAEALDQKKPFHNHLKHLVVHGFLHLLGFDHEETSDAEEMEALEIKILESLNIPNPYSGG